MTISRTTGEDGIATLTLDDGKANALDLTVFSALDAALDGCADASAVVIAGRPDMFSAGLNTKVLAALDGSGLRDLLHAFGRTMLRVWVEPRPVVAAATGHAIAGGTILAMACDHAVAASGSYRWGMNETAIGFPLPDWILTIARGNVRRDRLDDLLLSGSLVSPAEAVEVGFADVLASPSDVLESATARARLLADLPRTTYATTKARLRGAAARAALAGMDDDLAALVDGLGAG